jgi:hypothetical protein
VGHVFNVSLFRHVENVPHDGTEFIMARTIDWLYHRKG